MRIDGAPRPERGTHGGPRRPRSAGGGSAATLLAAALLLAAGIAAPAGTAATATANPPGSTAAAGESARTAAAGDPGILGFSREALAPERDLEALILRLTDRHRVERHARILTEEPHVAGTPENEAVARYIRDRFKEYGLQTELKQYPVYLGYVRSAILEQVAPRQALLSHPEDGFAHDKDSYDPRAALNWNGYSPSCDLTREALYVNYARPEDFDRVAALGIEVKDRIVLARYFHGYRGGKALEAERRGAAAVVFFSDPQEDGYVRGDVYPFGPWGPDGHIQRGATAYDFRVPGDPLTPGWPSTPKGRRIRPQEAENLPHIPSLPISSRDARVILENLAGPAAPHEFQGGLPLTYHLGPGPSRLHLKIDADFGVRTITDVIGVLRGTDEPERKVILGNHHDAWVYGAVDPISGTATMLELARVAGELARRGLRPRRTLVFGNWDGEEWTLTGSTEWGEEFADDLRAHGVVCLNVDSSASGPDFAASATPSLRRFLDEALRDVPDPRDGGDLFEVTLAERRERVESFASTYGTSTGEEGSAPTQLSYDLLGSGSDYTVFFNHIGMPSIDAGFEGPYGVYHSIYDDTYWMNHFGDPSYLYHTAMVKVWGVMAYRMANADLLPFEESPYAADVTHYLDELARQESRNAALPDLGALRAALADWTTAAADLDRRVAAALADGRPGAAALRAANDGLMRMERDLLRPSGIPGRPWFRHLIYAPLPTYAAETLPGLREALEAHDAQGARAQAAVLAAALAARSATARQAAAALAPAAP
jgi:N-acetylated-alpha-linked acidic dipeptidase